MHANLLSLLRCPISRRPLIPATAEELARVEAAITRGEIANAAGIKVTAPAEGMLIADDRSHAYFVRDGIPLLLPEESIPAPTA